MEIFQPNMHRSSAFLIHSTYGAPTTIVLPSFDIATDDPNLEPASGADITSVLFRSIERAVGESRKKEGKKGCAV